jgi:hypothetical protein
LMVKVHTPPAVDSYYAYVPKRPPAGVNTVYRDSEHPSSVMLPVVSLNDATLGKKPEPCSLTAVRCVP